jgi:nickel-type superoxide dismutase maturation protease
LVAGLAAWTILRWKPSRVRIEGASMVPTLVPGDWCLVMKPSRWRRDDVVVVEHPSRPGYEMVKRLAAIPGDRVEDRVLALREFWVLGDHPTSSTDSRHFGPVAEDAIRARLLLVYGPWNHRKML